MSKNFFKNYGYAFSGDDDDYALFYCLKKNDERREAQEQKSHELKQPTQPPRELTPEEQRVVNICNKINLVCKIVVGLCVAAFFGYVLFFM